MNMTKLRRPSFIFSYKHVEKANVPINKIDVGVQTFCNDEAAVKTIICALVAKLEIRWRLERRMAYQIFN